MPFDFKNQGFFEKKWEARQAGGMVGVSLQNSKWIYKTGVHTSNLHNRAPYYTHILLKNQKNRADTGSILYCNNSSTRYFFICQAPPRLLPIRMISPFSFNNWSEYSVALTDTPSA